MKECIKTIGNWCLTKLLKASTKVLVVAFLVLLTGTVLAATGNISDDSGQVNLVYVISGGLGIQILTVGIYVGKSNKTQKFLESAISALGVKHDTMQTNIGTMGQDVTSTGTNIKNLHHRLNKVEESQRSCLWFNRHPSEFAKKKGE